MYYIDTQFFSISYKSNYFCHITFILKQLSSGGLWGGGDWRDIPPWKNEGTSPPPGWKSEGRYPPWKNREHFTSVIFFLSTHKWPDFEIFQNPGGEGKNFLGEGLKVLAPSACNSQKIPLPENFHKAPLKLSECYVVWSRLDGFYWYLRLNRL